MIGLDCDPTIVHFLRACHRLDVGVDAINLRQVADEGHWCICVGGEGTSSITVGERTWHLEEYDAFYSRAIDLSLHQPSGWTRARWHGLMVGLTAWLDTAPALVVNRPSAGLNNGSKQLHEAILTKAGFSVPPSLTSSDGAELRHFAESGRTIVKTLSGSRANAREVRPEDFRRYEPDQGPVHVQRIVGGTDIRAHVIGTSVVSVQMPSRHVDYRADDDISYEPWQLPPATSEQLVRATRCLGLAFAGWDLKLDNAARYWCLEANPMPGYNPYDIADSVSEALLRFLGAEGRVVGNGDHRVPADMTT